MLLVLVVGCCCCCSVAIAVCYDVMVMNDYESKQLSNSSVMQQSQERESDSTQSHGSRMVAGEGGSKPTPSYLKGTASSNIRNRSQSFDSNNSSAKQKHHLQQPNTPSRSTSLDPTGMFRNRGRRVITKSSSVAPVDYSSTQQMIKSNVQNNYINVNSNAQNHKLIEDHTVTDVAGKNSKMTETGQDEDDGIIETNSDGDQISQKQLPLESVHPSAAINATPLDNSNGSVEKINDKNIDTVNTENDVDGSSKDDSIIRESDNPNTNNDSGFDESNEFIPSITIESLKRFELQTGYSNQLQNLLNTEGNIKQTLSKDSNDSEQCTSNIGSTISVMGSLVGENDGTTIGSFEYDKSKLNAVKRRMMKDVEEIAEVEENTSDCDDDDIIENDKPRSLSTDAVDIKGIQSIECNEEMLGRDMEHEYEAKNHENCVDDVDDDVQNVWAINDDTTNSNAENTSHIIETTSEILDESPLRAALRRKKESVANSLPSNLSTPTPQRFQSSYARTENAVASGLKVAQQCFSSENTTVDDSNFLAKPQLGGEIKIEKPTQEYYGLSGVASFGEDDVRPAESNAQKGNSTEDNNFPDISPSKKSAARPKWYPPISVGGKLLSPKVIHHRPGCDIEKSSLQPSGSLLDDQIRHSSSLDPELSPRRDKKTRKDLDMALTLLRAVAKESPLGTDDLHKQSLRCRSCQIEHSNGSVVHDNCSTCIETMKSIAESIKAVISGSEGSLETSIDEPKYDNEAQCTAIDFLMRTYQHALLREQSTLLAREWLESTEVERNESSSDATAHMNEANEKCLETAQLTVLRKQEEISRLNNELSKCRTEIGRLKSHSLEQKIPTLTINKSMLSHSSSDDSSTDGNPLNLSTPVPPVTYCDSHDESYIRFEKRIEADMNLEARKEIIFLKAALEKANRKLIAIERRTEICHDTDEPFSSEIEAIHASDTIEETEDMIIQIAESIENISIGSSLHAQEGVDEQQSDSQFAVSLEDPKLEKELDEYRTALIESLHVDEFSKRVEPKETPKSSIVEENVLNNVSSESSSDRRMVNVRMIDAENFTTEWHDLVEPLPPPPDHGLKSPIVDAILSKWTDDANTQSALIKWIESILKGTAADDSPSLKLSGLDHQIRDGFLMHVLPLLLLRKDIHVHITTRAHRHTTYDMAVSISQSVKDCSRIKSSSHGDRTLEDTNRRSKAKSQKHQLMAYQAAHSGATVNDSGLEESNVAPFSARQVLIRAAPAIVRADSHTESISTAVTAQISNRTSSSAVKSLFRAPAKDSYAKSSETQTPSRIASIPTSALGDDLSVGSSESVSEDSSKSQNQNNSSSIMGSISGAFGGLLSRQKGFQPSDLYHPLCSDKSPRVSSSSWSPTAFFTPQLNRGQEELKYEDIYHRVVSAPPGKIGLTFVEYEGNTMVSNVSDSSPLKGWVFPSDVIVAIDDTPVRDLRTRDIVQILTEKKGQQRNLRMFSLNQR